MCCAHLCFPKVLLFFIWNSTHLHLGFLLSTQLSFTTIFLNSFRRMPGFSLKWLWSLFSVAFKIHPYELVTQNYITVVKSVPIKRFFLKSQSKSYQSGKEIPLFSGIRRYTAMLTTVAFWIF